jgi:scyllo-inositol 2-dehydrogenase (NADP+)
MIQTVVVGYGLAGRSFHIPLLRRQPGIRLHGIVARDPKLRAEAEATEDVVGYPDMAAALANPEVELVVIATPHDSHPALAIEALRAGKHCVVDKVMALSPEDADRMIAARDETGKMLSVFHNRRWDWDFATVRSVLDSGMIGRPLLIESSVCRYASPRSWRGRAVAAGTILHDWGAHLVDQALHLGFGPCRRLAAWVTDAPWDGVDSGGHGKIVLEFDNFLFEVETSRICRLDRPRWSILGTEGGFVKYGVDPQEEALRSGHLDSANEAAGHVGKLVTEREGRRVETEVPSQTPSWDGYYENIVDHLAGRAPLAVTAEDGREVVRLLHAAQVSTEQHRTIEGPWG